MQIRCELCRGWTDQQNVDHLTFRTDFPRYICKDCGDRLEEITDQLAHREYYAR